MEAINTEAALNQLAETALGVVDRVMTAQRQMTHAEAEIRLLANRLGDTVVAADREEWKRDTLKLWLEMADYIAQAIVTLDGRPVTTTELLMKRYKQLAREWNCANNRPV